QCNSWDVGMIGRIYDRKTAAVRCADNADALWIDIFLFFKKIYGSTDVTKHRFNGFVTSLGSDCRSISFLRRLPKTAAVYRQNVESFRLLSFRKIIVRVAIALPLM